jgi:hypothetical protein
LEVAPPAVAPGRQENEEGGGQGLKKNMADRRDINTLMRALR